MESKLVNHFTFSADNLRVAYRHNFRNWRLFRYIECLICLCIPLTTSLKLRNNWAQGSHNTMLLLLNLCTYGIVVFFFWQTVSARNRHVKRTIQRLEETKHVSSFEQTIHFLDNEMLITVSLDSDTQHILYSSVKRLVPYQNLILVYTQAKQLLILDSSRFENGCEADFWNLMNEKSPKAVPRRHASNH
ncbi:MAG: hypothetical protein IIY94_06350 [Oscillospiraceae bacterium]|nr:hypothetical protein [Oscillospiraceae bacterium]